MTLDFATIDRAIEGAASDSAHAETVMGIVAFLAPERIPVSIISWRLMEPCDRDRALGLLSKASLLTRNSRDDGVEELGVHSLVQYVMRDQLERAGDHDAAALATMLLSDAFPGGLDDARSREIAERLLPHMVAVLRFAPEVGASATTTATLLDQLGRFSEWRGVLAEAEAYLKRSLAIREAVLKPGDVRIGRSLTNLAELYCKQGRLTEAKPLQQRAAAIAE